MKKKRRIEEEDHADRWVVSYADFMTLLFAFFTTMYAISQVDAGKLARFSGSIKSAFKATGANAIDTTVIPGIKPINYADIALEKDTREEFNKFAILEEIAINRDERGVVLSLGDSLLFDSGTADMAREARPLLTAVAALMVKSRRSVIIEGHTDNLPLQGRQYPSNVELSAARAGRLLQILCNEESIAPDRITVAGYGEFRPVASNATPEGRARNRRVDIVFVASKNGT